MFSEFNQEMFFVTSVQTSKPASFPDEMRTRIHCLSY